jgi:hypothetical protein
LLRASLESLPEIEQQQLERVNPRRLEFEVFVESASRLIYGVHHHSPDCNYGRSLFNPFQSVEKKRFTEASALLAPVYRRCDRGFNLPQSMSGPLCQTIHCKRASLEQPSTISKNSAEFSYD